MSNDADRVVFVQLSNFSDTNGAVERALPARLHGRRLDVVSVWSIFKKSPIWLALGVAAGLRRHGLGRLRSGGALHAAVIKTPLFFRIASHIARREIARGGPAAAVLITQGLFDPTPVGGPLIVYTDDCMLNPANRLFALERSHPSHVAQERRLFEHAARIAVGGSHVARALASEYGLGPEKVTVVGMGANVARPERRPEDDALARYAAGRILFVGYDWERKGGPELVEAFRRLSPRHPHARLTIAGATPEIDHPAVEVLGRCPPERIAELMRAASIFSLPSRLEPFGIATVEAARFGLPTVATTVGGFPDTVVEGETGFLVPPGDVDALETALDRLLADPERARTMGRRATEWAWDRFSWDTVAARLAELIEAAIAERGAER